MTPEQKIARRLRQRIQGELSPADLLAALQALPPAQRDVLVEAARKGRASVMGKVVADAVAAFVNAAADTEAAQLLADGSLSLAEIDRVLG